MKLLIIFVAVAMLSGCMDKPQGSEIAVEERCVKGVTYYLTGYQLAPAFRADGSLYTCSTKD